MFPDLEGRNRELWINALEGRLVQTGFARIFGVIYEGNFIEDS